MSPASPRPPDVKLVSVFDVSIQPIRGQPRSKVAVQFFVSPVPDPDWVEAFHESFNADPMRGQMAVRFIMRDLLSVDNIGPNYVEEQHGALLRAIASANSRWDFDWLSEEDTSAKQIRVANDIAKRLGIPMAFPEEID